MLTIYGNISTSLRKIGSDRLKKRMFYKEFLPLPFFISIWTIIYWYLNRGIYAEIWNIFTYFLMFAGGQVLVNQLLFKANFHSALDCCAIMLCY